MAAGVLVVTLDRLPAWILPAWGSTWLATPALDQLAARGLVLDRLLATGTTAAGTLAALAGGPGGLLEAGATMGAGWTVVTDDPAALPPALAAVPRRVEVALPARAAVAREPEQTALGRLMAAAVAAVRGAPDGAVWCHATSLGRVWDAPEGVRDAYVDPDDPPPPPGAAVPSFAVTADTDPDLLVGVRHLYAGQVTLLDRALAPLLAAVPAGWCILVAGVRGLALGLHSRVGPADDEEPFGEIVHLPALVCEPTGTLAAQRDGLLAIPADVGATVARLLGGGATSPEGPWDGHDLWPALADGSSPPRDRVVIDGGGGMAVATAAWYLVAARGAGRPDAGHGPRLFAKPDDFFEVSDVADRSPAVAEELAAILSAPTAPVVGGPDRDLRGAWERPLSAAACGGAEPPGGF
jgi:hypothetical protein